MILDTNALSAAADQEPAALKIVANAESLAVPVIVLGEYRLGIAQSRYRKDYENWLRECYRGEGSGCGRADYTPLCHYRPRA